MKKRVHRQQQASQHSDSTHVTNQFQSCPFSVPTAQVKVSPDKQEMPSLQAQYERAKRFGHNIANISQSAHSPLPAHLPTGSLIQPKLDHNDISSVGATQLSHPFVQRSLDNFRQRRSEAKLETVEPIVPQLGQSIRIQPKLVINQPGDKYKQEVDQMADQVISIPGLALQQPIQRQEMPEEEKIYQIYDSPQKAPNYPQGFRPVKNGTTRNNINNRRLLDKLRKIEPGKWQKVYKDGFDSSGSQVSVHYFQSRSGKVFDLKTKPGWSNL